MPRRNWNLLDLLRLVTVAALTFAAYRDARLSPDLESVFYLDAYFLSVATATLGAFFGRPGLRRPCQGYAIFGGFNLVCLFNVLMSLTDEAFLIVAKMGTLFGLICALIAPWITEPLGEKSDPA